MAPRKGATLSAMADAMSEDEIAHSQDVTLDSATENRQPAKKKRVNAKTASNASKVTKSKTTARRTSGSRRTSGASLLTNAKANAKRKALTERTANAADGNETEEVETFDEPNAAETLNEEAYVIVSKPVKKTQSKAAQKSMASRKRTVQPEPEPMEVDGTAIEDDDPTPRAIARPQAVAVNRSRSLSRQPDTIAGPHRRRAGSASSTDRDGGAGIRRKLGETTKKLENLSLKYQTLKETAVTETQNNLEKLRKAGEQRAKDQDELIASLKRELATQKSLHTDSKSLRSQLSQLQSDNARLATENKSLSTNLHESQNEVKSLTAKLSAARSASAERQNPPSNPPNNAPKSSSHQRGTSANSTKQNDLGLEKLKEDLYSDLTGLMIRNVKRLDEEDVYDCIQTGRNGTLHFHLSISHNPPPITTPGSQASTGGYDDIEFAYTPLLDAKNDRDLLEILPDYLTEEICFPRSSAAKFYAKVGEVMSRRVEVVE